MLKINKRYLIIGMMFLLPAMGCEHFLDINDDPNRAKVVSSDALLAPILVSTGEVHYSLGLYTSLFAQQLAAYTSGPLEADQHIEARANAAWNNIYTGVLNNASQLVRQSAEQGSSHYVGIGKVIQALNLGLATDAWGPVPFSEAFKGPLETTPSYDQQEQIYATIQRLLDEALVELQKPNSLVRPRQDDVIYNGNIAKWIRAAHSLKARYAIHLTEKEGAQAAARALESLAMGIQTNADDMQVVYNTRNLNPWHRNIAIGTTTGNFIVAPSKTLMDLMNGNMYSGLVDPRLPFMADRGASAANYAGHRNGAGSGGNTNITANTFYAQQTSPVLMVTNAEMRFIEAEARFIVNGGNRTSTGSTPEAYQAYLAGITAHMNKLGVSSEARNAYLNDPLVAVGAENLRLEHIMKEKLIALYLNPEAWVDVRRYDYSPAIYKGMSLPENHNTNLNGQFIRRVLYPQDELARNAEEVNKVAKGLAEKMWWDQ